MAVVLFTWNPSFFHVSDRQWNREIKQIQDCGFLYSQWSCGRSKFIQPGDDAFLLRQGTDRRGIVAHGTVTSEYFEAPTWDDEKEEDTVVNYVDITWTTQLPIDQRLTIETLQLQIPKVYWSPQGSGTQVPEESQEKLFELWNTTTNQAGITPGSIPSRIQAPQTLIEHQNGFCAICGINPATIYQTQPASFFTSYTFVTTSTQIAVCPNCQLFASNFATAQTIDDLKQIMSGQF